MLQKFELDSEYEGVTEVNNTAHADFHTRDFSIMRRYRMTCPVFTIAQIPRFASYLPPYRGLEVRSHHFVFPHSPSPVSPSPRLAANWRGLQRRARRGQGSLQGSPRRRSREDHHRQQSFRSTHGEARRSSGRGDVRVGDGCGKEGGKQGDTGAGHRIELRSPAASCGLEPCGSRVHDNRSHTLTPLSNCEDYDVQYLCSQSSGDNVRSPFPAGCHRWRH